MARVNGKPLPANYMVELKVRWRDEMRSSVTGGWVSARMRWAGHVARMGGEERHIQVFGEET